MWYDKSGRSLLTQREKDQKHKMVKATNHVGQGVVIVMLYGGTVPKGLAIVPVGKEFKAEFSSVSHTNLTKFTLKMQMEHIGNLIKCKSYRQIYNREWSQCYSAGYEHVCSCFIENPTEKQEFNFISRICNLLQMVSDLRSCVVINSTPGKWCILTSSSIHFASFIKGNKKT